jgi:hypothetical protein
MNPGEMQWNIDRSIELIPDEAEGEWAPDPARLEDVIAAARARAKEAVAAMEAQADSAAAALAYAITCRQGGGAQDAARAGGRTYEALDNWVINRDDIDPNKPGAEERVLSDPLIQAEFARQRRDLDELLGVRDEGEAAGVVARIRARAKADSGSVFG